MAGWEDLSSEQLMAIVYLVFLSVLIFSSSHMISSFLNWMASKNIKFHMNKEVAVHVAKELQKPTIFQSIKIWWAERKLKKEEKKTYRSPFKD